MLPYFRLRLFLLRATLAAVVAAAALTAFSSSPRTALALAPDDDIADYAIGTPNGFSGGQPTACVNGALNATILCNPGGAVFDADGNLYIADLDGNRVLGFASPATTDNVADLVIGQPGFTTNLANNGGISANSLFLPRDVAVDAAGNLYVVDVLNNRVLEYNTPFSSGATADMVLGQGGLFTTGTANMGGISADSLNFPVGVSLDSAGNLYVADGFNNRVLEFDNPLINGTTADRVFGQLGSFASGVPNVDGLSANSLFFPIDAATDAAGNLYITDAVDNRVLEYNTPLVSGTTADRVLGQGGSFSSGTVNLGGLSASSLSGPGTITITGGTLVVADTGNTRVLAFQNPVSTDTVADRVLGQGGNFTTSAACGAPPSASCLSAASGVAVDPDGTLLLSDNVQRRALLFRYPFVSDDVADRQIGWNDAFDAAGCNAGGVSAASLCGPNDVAVDGAGNVYVADASNNRVLEYNTPLSTDFVADRVFGQGGSFTSTTPNNGGVSADSLDFPAGVAVDGAGNLYVTDVDNQRVLEYDTPLVTNTTADRVFAQPSMITNTCNNGGITASSLCVPYDVTLDATGNVYVSDYGNHRVLEYNTPLSSDLVADRVFGQPGMITNSCNSGGISATALCLPAGIDVDASGNLFVADQVNNRALKYNSPLADATADVVYGQGGSFTSDVCHLGGISASSLCNVTGIDVDATGEVYISANNRILRYTGGGTTAVQVFGQQGSFVSASCNNGGMTARSLCFARFVTTDQFGRLYVADFANHRVLVFAANGCTGDKDCDGVLDSADDCTFEPDSAQLNSDRNFIDNSPPYAPATDDKTRARSDPMGDRCDADDDNDGVSDAVETGGCPSSSGPTSPIFADSDADRFLDGAECALGTNPASSASTPVLTACAAAGDPDGDKIQSRLEVCFYNANPNSNDTDGDAVGGLDGDGGKDGCEIASLNGDQEVNSGDQGMLGAGIVGTQPYTVNVDVNKDGVLNSGDQGLQASFIVPPGQCP